jgi:hypothetical protein
MKEVPENSMIITYWWPGMPLKYFQIVYDQNPNLTIKIANPADWSKYIDQWIDKKEIFLLDFDEEIQKRYIILPALTMPNVGVLYKVHPETPSFSVSNPTIYRQVNKPLGKKLNLVGYDLNKTEPKSKNKFSIKYYWQIVNNTSKNYIVHLDIVDQNGNVILEDVHAPVYNYYPTSRWIKDTIFAESYNMILPPDVPAGTYQLILKGGEYIDPSDPSKSINEYLKDDKILLRDIEIVGNEG